MFFNYRNGNTNKSCDIPKELVDDQRKIVINPEIIFLEDQLFVRLTSVSDWTEKPYGQSFHFVEYSNIREIFYFKSNEIPSRKGKKIQAPVIFIKEKKLGEKHTLELIYKSDRSVKKSFENLIEKISEYKSKCKS